MFLKRLSADLVLLDHTSFRPAEALSALAGLHLLQLPTMLLPHAPHHAHSQAFTPFLPDDPLPGFCEFWQPHPSDQSWRALPGHRHQFHYVGYPGLDHAWLEHCLEKVRGDRPRELTCLWVIRRFLPPKQARTPETDHFILDYDEFINHLQMLKQVVDRTPQPLRLIIKPHPANDFNLLAATCHTAGLRNWTVSHESIYSLLPQLDLAVSLYSTIPLILAGAGIPTVLVDSSTQRAVHDGDPAMRDLYGGLSLFCTLDDLPNRFAQALDLARQRRTGNHLACQSDMEHVRRHYPDGAASRCMARINASRPSF